MLCGECFTFRLNANLPLFFIVVAYDDGNDDDDFM